MMQLFIRMITNKINLMEDIKKSKPTPADFEKRRLFTKRFNESSVTDEENFDYLDFMNSIDWSAETFEEEGLCGLKTSLGEMVLPPVFEVVCPTYEVNNGDRIVVMQNKKWGVVIADTKGTWLIQPEFDYIGYPNALTQVCKDGKWGVLNITTGEYLIPLTCDKVFSEGGYLFVNGIGTFEKDGKLGVITQYGAFTQPIFEEVEFDDEAPVKVKLNGEWGYINEENQFSRDEEEASYFYEM